MDEVRVPSCQRQQRRCAALVSRAHDDMDPLGSDAGEYPFESRVDASIARYLDDVRPLQPGVHGGSPESGCIYLAQGLFSAGLLDAIGEYLDWVVVSFEDGVGDPCAVLGAKACLRFFDCLQAGAGIVIADGCVGVIIRNSCPSIEDCDPDYPIVGPRTIDALSLRARQGQDENRQQNKQSVHPAFFRMKVCELKA